MSLVCAVNHTSTVTAKDHLGIVKMVYEPVVDKLLIRTKRYTLKLEKQLYYLQLLHTPIATKNQSLFINKGWFFMKINRKITCYSSFITFFTVAAAYLALLLVPNKDYGLAVAIFLGLALATNCFFRMVKVIVEPERDRKILLHILGLIVNIESTTYFAVLLISRQDYHFIVGILFFLAMVIYYLCSMIKLLIESAGERQNEQEDTFWTKK